MIPVILLILKIFLIYMIIIYTLSFIITPRKIPEKIPKDMKIAIKRINKKNLNNLQFLKKAFELVNKRYSSIPRGFITYPLRIFDKNLGSIWRKTGFQPCDNQSYVLKVMLIKSKRFKENDIKIIFNTYFIFWPHQYLKIKAGNKWYDVDLWGIDRKIKFGGHFGI